MITLKQLREAIAELAHRKLRTLLTLLGMIFGVGAVIAMLSVGEGARRESLRLIERMGLRNLVVETITTGEEQLRERRERSLGLSLLDVRAGVDTLPYVESFSAEREVKAYAVYGFDGRAESRVFGVTPSHFEMASLNVREGRLFDANDAAAYAQVCVLGGEAANALFPHGDALGGVVKVDHLWLRVIGVLQDRDAGSVNFEGVTLGNEANQLFLPLETALKKLKFGKLTDELDAFRVKLREGVSPAVAAASLDHLLERRHSGVRDYRLIVPAQLMAQRERTQRIFTIVMACVAGISLLVGGIGIMNIMLATVLERRSEIGLLRAVGATRRDIVSQFLGETFAISLAGAMLGIVFGVALAYVIGGLAGWPVAWSPLVILFSVAFCVGIGIVFGVYPARQASMLDPVQALHSE